MNKLVTILTVLSSFSGQLTYAAATESLRCTDKQDSLTEAEAAGRTAWAFKCYPAHRAEMPNKVATLKDTQTNTSLLGYPTFGKTDDDGNFVTGWQAPTDPNASCDPAKEYSLLGFCKAGCYTPGNKVLFSNGFMSIVMAANNLRDDIVTVSPNSTIDNVELIMSELKDYTVDPVAKTQKILDIKTRDAGELKVTLNHPLLDSSGNMRVASTLRVGESLVKMDGQPDQIVSITEHEYTGKVYNVTPASNDPADNIVVAQGYLNGSTFYQNEGVKDLNRQMLRSGNNISNNFVK